MDAEEKLLENGYEGIKYPVGDSYDDALIGVIEDSNWQHAVYDYNLKIKWLMDNDNMSSEDAAEWIDYNTVRAIPYMGQDAPMIMYPLDDWENATG